MANGQPAGLGATRGRNLGRTHASLAPDELEVKLTFEG